MRRHRAARQPIHRALVAFRLALVMAEAAAARQSAPTPPRAGASGAAPPVAGAPGQGSKAQAEACPPPGLESVWVSKVRSVPPFEEEAGAAGGARAEQGRRTSGRGRVSGQDKKHLPIVELRDSIAVTVEGLDILLAQERCLEEKNGAERDIILYLDRRPLPDVVAHPPNDPKQKVLMFPMIRTEDSREVWTYLLGRPKLKAREVEVSVGIDNQFAVQSAASVYLRVIPRRWFSFWVLIFATLAIGFVVLALRSDLLRDPVLAPPGARPPYSLSRTQAAWWLFLVLASYLLIGMVTGDFSTSITGTVLVLLGISAGTAAGSAFVDASKTSLASEAQDAARATSLQAELKTLDQEVAALGAEMRTTGDPVKARELTAKESSRVEKLSRYRKITNQSESFLLDILSDTNGVNFHRFQILAWTLVLGIIFGGHVYRDLAMPQFNDTLLALMGISAGTYLGLKIPENQAPEAPPANPAPPP